MAEWTERRLDPNVDKLIQLGGGVAPEFWSAAVAAQWRRVEEIRDEVLARYGSGEGMVRDMPEEGKRLRYDSYFLVMAVRQLLRVEEAYRRLTGDARLTKARSAFDATIPDAKLFRDILEHLDAYMQGKGDLQGEGRIRSHPVLEPVITRSPPRRVALRFDGHQLDLGNAARAALDLAPVIAQVWTERVAKGLGEWTGSEPLVE